MESPLLRFASPADLPHVAATLQELGGMTFRERIGAHTLSQFYRWKYYANPNGEAVIGIAVTDSQVVSTAVATPVALQLGERRCRAYVLGDFFTVPEFRKMGLFSRLLRNVIAECARRQAEVLYVQPNEQSAPALMRQEFDFPVELRQHSYAVPSHTLERKLRLPAAFSRAIGLDFAARRWVSAGTKSDTTVEPAMRLGAEADALWRRLQAKFAFAAVRDATQWNWRYADCPAAYRFLAAKRPDVTGVAVVSHNPESGLATLEELLADPADQETIDALIQAALTDATDAGLHRLYAWAIQGPLRSPVDDQIRRTFPLAAREPLRVAVRWLVPGLRVPAGVWHLSPGSFDGV